MFKREKTSTSSLAQHSQSSNSLHRAVKKELSLRGRPKYAVADSLIGGDLAGDASRNRTLLVVFPTLAGYTEQLAPIRHGSPTSRASSEFQRESDVLRQVVLPEVQQYCSDGDVDMGFFYLCASDSGGRAMDNYEQISLLGSLLSQSSNVSVLLFLGDKYGAPMLPMEMRADEFQKLQSAALEGQGSNDVKLLEQFYALDRTQVDQRGKYRLRYSRKNDLKAERRLLDVLQAAVKKMMEDGGGTAGEEAKKAGVSNSFAEMAVDLVSQSPSTPHIIVSRKFSGHNVKDAGDRWAESSPSAAERIAALKNRVSKSVGDATKPSACIHLPFIHDLAGTSPDIWFDSKEGAAYERQLASKLGDALKMALRLPLASPSTQCRLSSTVEISEELAESDHQTHTKFMEEVKPVGWVARESLDTKLNEIIEAGMKQPLRVNIRGNVGCGKTAAICRLHQLLEARGRDCMVITRFASIADTALSANELFRSLLFKLHQLLGADSSALRDCFSLRELLAALSGLMSASGARKPLPLFILIDDFHLLRFGHALSSSRASSSSDSATPPLLSALANSANVSFIVSNARPTPSQQPASTDTVITSPEASTEQMNHWFPNMQPYELAAPSVDQILEVVKSEWAKSKRKLGSDQLGVLRTNLKKPGSSLVNAQIASEELLMSFGPDTVGAEVDSRLNWIEARCGKEDTKMVAHLIANSLCGLTTLEIGDAYRMGRVLFGTSSGPIATSSSAASANVNADAFGFIPLLVVKYLGCLLVRTSAEGREVWAFRHASVCSKVRKRYLSTPMEVKCVNETMARVMSSVVARSDAGEGATEEGSVEEVNIAGLLLFPQPLYRAVSELEASMGAVNMRRARFHWYYLLYAGDVERLKLDALCSFDYLEAVLRGCGLAHLLSMFEEVLSQIVDHDLLVIFEQVLLPSIVTLGRDSRQLVSEFLNRLRYTRARNSKHLNACVEEAMQWTDSYDEGPLLVPLTCWIAPQKMKQIASFTIPRWTASRTVIQPTHNHQHLLMAGNEDGKNLVYMFHIASQLLVRTFAGHDSKISSLTTSNDGQFFVCTAHDGSIRQWSLTQSTPLKSLRASDAKALCSLISTDDKWIVVGSADSAARVIDLESGEVRRTFREHTGPVIGLQLTSDNELLVTGSGDFAVMVWDIEAGVILMKMVGLMAPVTCLAITSNDTFLAVACEDETLRIFSMVSAQELHELSGHDSRVNALAASTDNCQIFAATKGRVIVYDIHNGQLLETLQCVSKHPVTSLEISDDNTFIFAFCKDTAHVWNMNSIGRDYSTTAPEVESETTAIASRTEPLASGNQGLSCIRMAPDEKGAGCGTVDGILAFWDLEVCQCLWTTAQQREGGAITALEFTLDSMYLLSGNERGAISMWEVSNGRLAHRLQIHQREVYVICCFPDGVRVISSDRSNQALIWNLGSGEGAGGGAGGSGGGEDSGQVEILTVIPGARISLLTRTYDSVLIGRHSKNSKEMNVWSIEGVETNILLKTKAHHNEEIVCFGINRSGTWFSTGSLDLSLKVWQAETGFLTQVLVGHEEVMSCCCVSEDGTVVVSGGRDKLLIIWDVKTGNASNTIKQHGATQLVDISQDGSVLLSADDQGWIEAWSTTEGVCLSSLNTHRLVDQLTMGLDGNRILARLSHTQQLPILCLHNTPAHRISGQQAAILRVSSTKQRAQGSKSSVGHAKVLPSASHASDQNEAAGKSTLSVEKNNLATPAPTEEAQNESTCGQNSEGIIKSAPIATLQSNGGQNTTLTATNSEGFVASSDTRLNKRSKACDIL